MTTEHQVRDEKLQYDFKREAAKILADEQLPLIKDFLLKERLSPEIVDEIEKIEEEERKTDKSKMVCEGSNETYAYDFRKFKTIRVFGNTIRNYIINMSMAKPFVKTY